MSAKQRIGIVGAGLMGHGIAKNLVEKGFRWPCAAIAIARRSTTSSSAARRK
jgi:3-hydroxyisobutyrate dehydrogenase-like beta-hydroxyacid dehydrogenase